MLTNYYENCHNAQFIVALKHLAPIELVFYGADNVPMEMLVNSYIVPFFYTNSK